MGCRKLIWTPEDEPRAGFARGIGGRVSGRRMLNSPVLPSAGFSGNFADLFPGAYQVVQTDRGLTYSGTPLPTAANTSTTALTLTGTLATTPVPILVKAENTLAIGAGATFSISYDGGATQAMTGVNPTAGVPVALTGAALGLLIAWSVGASVANDTWTATSAALADQSGNGKDFSQASAPKQLLLAPGLSGKATLVARGATGSSSFVSTLNLPVPGTTPYYTFAVFRQLSWTINATMWGRTSGLGETVFQTTATPALSSYSGTAIANGGAAINQWVIAELTRSNSAGDTHKFGSTTVTGSSGNNATTGLEIGSATGIGYGNIEIACLVHTPNLPNWAQVRSAVTSFYGASVLL